MLVLVQVLVGLPWTCVETVCEVGAGDVAFTGVNLDLCDHVWTWLLDVVEESGRMGQDCWNAGSEIS